MHVEKMIQMCEKLPGYYGYRPSMIGESIEIDELMFRLNDSDENCEYSLSIFMDNNRISNTKIDVRYSDGSIASVMDNELKFKDIVGHKNKLVKFLQKI
jgi:hypothetical protein